MSTNHVSPENQLASLIIFKTLLRNAINANNGFKLFAEKNVGGITQQWKEAAGILANGGNYEKAIDVATVGFDSNVRDMLITGSKLPNLTVSIDSAIEYLSIVHFSRRAA